MKNKKYKPGKPENNLNEPASSYLKGNSTVDPWKNITVSSQEEQEEANRIFSANLTHLERMAVLQQLIQITFGEHLKRPVGELWNKKIYITQDG